MEIIAFFDGACLFSFQGGHASHGAVIYRDDEIVWQEAKIVVPENNALVTNNLAEYSGFLAVLTELKKRNVEERPITIYGDSMLVIKQMTGLYKIKRGAYVPLALTAKRLIESFTAVKPVWIPREQNSIADALTRKTLLDAGLICSECLENDKPYQKWCACPCHKGKTKTGSEILSVPLV